MNPDNFNVRWQLKNHHILVTALNWYVATEIDFEVNSWQQQATLIVRSTNFPYHSSLLLQQMIIFFLHQQPIYAFLGYIHHDISNQAFYYKFYIFPKKLFYPIKTIFWLWNKSHPGTYIVRLLLMRYDF